MKDLVGCLVEVTQRRGPEGGAITSFNAGKNFPEDLLNKKMGAPPLRAQK